MLQSCIAAGFRGFAATNLYRLHCAHTGPRAIMGSWESLAH